MNKRKIILDDRRYLIFYSFKDAGTGQKPAPARRRENRDAENKRGRRKS